MGEDKTVPFFKVPKEDRQQALENIRKITGGDKTKITVEVVKTAFKSRIGAHDSRIAAVPRVVDSHYGPTLRIPLKGSDPAFASLKQIQSYC